MSPGYEDFNVNGVGRTATVTFRYPTGLRTLVAPNRILAFERARKLWGDGWVGEPCVSTPETVYADVTGLTRMKHGQAKAEKDSTKLRRRALRREGRL